MAPLQFGCLTIPYQALDVVAPLDVLNSSSKAYFEALAPMGTLPPGLVERGLDIEFHHINETLDPVLVTGNLSIKPTTTCDTCPPLDYLLVGGPPPAYKLTPRFIEFLKEHVNRGKVLFTTCTGAFCVAQSGILDGKNATTNHQVIPLAKQIFPQVKWTDEKQWVIDGQFWTAGGACAGMDMIAHWVMENYGMDLTQVGFAMLDYKPRDVDGSMVLPQQHGVAASGK